MADFEVINGNKSEENDTTLQEVETIIAFNKMELWEKYYQRLWISLFATGKSFSDATQDNLMKSAYAGVRYFETRRNMLRLADKTYGFVETKESKEKEFGELEILFSFLGCLTPRSLMIAFPITKRFDGHKWQSKDYFSTMEEISKYDMDKQIGKDAIMDFLWDYDNLLLRELYVQWLCVVSALRRLNGEEGIMEHIAKEMNIPTYSINNESRIIQNNQTGETKRLVKHNNMRIIK